MTGKKRPVPEEADPEATMIPMPQLRVIPRSLPALPYGACAGKKAALGRKPKKPPHNSWWIDETHHLKSRWGNNPIRLRSLLATAFCLPLSLNRWEDSLTS